MNYHPHTDYVLLPSQHIRLDFQQLITERSIVSVSVPTKRTVPASTASGLSVVSRITKLAYLMKVLLLEYHQNQSKSDNYDSSNTQKVIILRGNQMNIGIPANNSLTGCCTFGFKCTG
jgi:hypothetical protein